MTPDLPPPPEPPPVLAAADVLDSDTVRVPLATWRWHRLRDAYADQQTAYIDQLVARYQLVDADLADARLDLVVVGSERDAAVWEAEQLYLHVGRLESRPSWRTVAVVGGVLVVLTAGASVYAWERVR